MEPLKIVHLLRSVHKGQSMGARTGSQQMPNAPVLQRVFKVLKTTHFKPVNTGHYGDR